MHIYYDLATNLGRRDEQPNIALAEKIAAQQDIAAVAELPGLLAHNNKHIQGDAIKVLYETGARAPGLIAGHAATFIALLQSPDQRMVWGAMTALSTIAAEVPGVLHKALSSIMMAAEGPSVIARDHAVKILVTLAKVPAFYDDAMTLLLTLLISSPENQFPTYAESIAQVMQGNDLPRLRRILRDRLPVTVTPTKARRIEKLLSKIK